MSGGLTQWRDLSKERRKFNNEQLRNLYRPQNKRHFRVDGIKRNYVSRMSFGGSERREMSITFC